MIKMNKITKTLLVIGVTALVISYLSLPQNQTEQVTVIRVIDGDTIDVEGHQESIRFLGVDTPELTGEHRPGEFKGIENNSCLVEWAEKSTDYVRQKLQNKEINLVFDSKAGKTGYYGRTLAYIELNGEDFTKSLVKKGYARVYTEGEFKRKEEYLKAEEEAQIMEKRIWECN